MEHLLGMNYEIWLIWSVTRHRRRERVSLPRTLAIKSKGGREENFCEGEVSHFFSRIKVFFLLSWFWPFPTKPTKEISILSQQEMVNPKVKW